VKGASARNLLIDALRFVAIAMVVLTHVLNLRWEFKELPLAAETVRALMAFNMPLFAFVSGYVNRGLERDGPWRFARSKATALLVPYYAWIIVEMPLRRVALADAPERLVRAAIDPMAAFQMWFLLVLFYAFVLLAASRLVSRSEWWLGGVALVVGLLPLVWQPASNLIVRLCWLYPFVVGGYLVAQHRESCRRFDDAAAVAGLVAFPFLFASGWDGSVHRLAIGAAGSAALWALFRWIPEPVLRRLAWTGSKSLGVYGGQMVLLPFLIVGAGWSGAFASWMLVTAAAVVLTVVLERFALTRAVFLGRWPKGARRAS
jgi:surface polysaccharide O-acyltransferase-like enzyme